MHRFLICALVTRDFFLSDIYLLPVISRARFASLYSQHIGSALKQHALHVSVWVRVETNTFLLYCYMPSRDVLGVGGVPDVTTVQYVALLLFFTMYNSYF